MRTDQSSPIRLTRTIHEESTDVGEPDRTPGCVRRFVLVIVIVLVIAIVIIVVIAVLQAQHSVSNGDHDYEEAVAGHSGKVPSHIPVMFTNNPG